MVLIVSPLVWKVPIGYGVEEDDLERFSSVDRVEVAEPSYYTVFFSDTMEQSDIRDFLQDYGLSFSSWM
jgi:hypothetical protein